jgi:hypothetical protein
MAFLDMPVGRSVFLVGDSGRIEEVSSSIPPQQAVDQFMATEPPRASDEADFMAEFERQFNEAAAEGPPAVASFTVVDTPPGKHPRGARDASGQPLHRLLVSLYSPAVDAQGNADCQRGQEGYPNGPFTTGGRYGAGALSDKTPAGGNASVTDPDSPGLAGGTYKARELGIDHVEDVP